MLASAGIAALLFPLTTISPEELRVVSAAQPMEVFDDLDLGPGYGEVSVIELLGFYLENPPEEPGVVVPVEELQRHFGGC